MSFNGWKNRQTWNVSLWLQNDEKLYEMIKNTKIKYKSKAYQFFIAYNNLEGKRTEDGVLFDDPRLDTYTLSQLVFDINRDRQ